MSATLYKEVKYAGLVQTQSTPPPLSVPPHSFQFLFKVKVTQHAA